MRNHRLQLRLCYANLGSGLVVQRFSGLCVSRFRRLLPGYLCAQPVQPSTLGLKVHTPGKEFRRLFGFRLGGLVSLKYAFP